MTPVFASLSVDLPEWPLLVEGLFAIYLLASFVFVARYGVRQVRLHRLVNNADAPLPFSPPVLPASVLIACVLGLIFVQSMLYPLVAVFGIAGFLGQTGRRARDQFGLDRLRPGKLLAAILLVCGTVVLIELPLDRLITYSAEALHITQPEEQAVKIFRQLNRPDQITAFIVEAVLVFPLIEELFFRGFLFVFLKNYTSTWLALFLSAGVFAFAHVSLGSVLQLWVLGLVLGLAYEHTGSLLLSIGIHGCWNLLTALGLLLEKSAS